MQKTTVALFLVLMVLGGLVAASFRQVTSGAPFYYDEADYMYAGTRGLASNFMDSPSMSVAEFIREGLAFSRGKGERSSLSERVRSSGDITFYRHYHGPMYAYWIGLNQAAGVQHEDTYRASGLILHLITVTLLFWAYRVAFPLHPPVAAFIAAFTLLINRTALLSATTITQHVMFTLTCAVTLFLVALYARTGKRLYWYGTGIALGVSFATVESSFILVGAIILVLALLRRRSGWAALWTLLWQGTLAFIAGVTLVWPKGILMMASLKGYIYLAYMAIARKTFTPISPVALWKVKLLMYPEEFVIPIAAMVVAALWWKKFREKEALLPFLIYGWMFIAVTLVITAPFTYYHASLMMTAAVITGAVAGEFWKTTGPAVKAIAAVILVASFSYMTARFHGEMRQVVATGDTRTELLRYVTSQEAAGLRYLETPSVLVPTLHFYHPAMLSIGYDENVEPAKLAARLTAKGTGAELFCEVQVCDAVAAQIPTPLHRTLVMAGRQDLLNLGPLYSVSLENR